MNEDYYCKVCRNHGCVSGCHPDYYNKQEARTMNWTTEVPKESGWYWAIVAHDNCKQVVHYSRIGKVIHQTGYSDWLGPEDIISWGDKLEIPE